MSASHPRERDTVPTGQDVGNISESIWMRLSEKSLLQLLMLFGI
jgi:hypothetical protein